MPQMMPPLKGVSFSQAYAEAMAIAPAQRPMLVTLEMRHPGFRDEDGGLYVPRIVNNKEALVATLEADAPVNAGEEVTFEPLPFDANGLDETDGGVAPTLEISIDGVSLLIVQQLDYAIQSLEPVRVTFRLYAADQRGGPAFAPVPTMTLRDVVLNETTVSARAVFNDPSNTGFPRREYTFAKYPGLTAR